MSGLAEGRATCAICPHGCQLAEGQTGLCHARVAAAGQVVDANYGRVTSLALDPIEKKPLARFKPGTKVLSVGSYGCNLRCPFCQNAAIACAGENDVPWREMAPAELVELAASLMPEGNIGIAFTYNEPLVGFEFVHDTARLAHERSLANVLVSNGYVNDGPLREIAPLIGAANIDLKGYTQSFYDLVGGDLDTVSSGACRRARLPPGGDDAHHPRPERRRGRDRCRSRVARIAGSGHPLPHNALLPLPPPAGPPRHAARYRAQAGRHSPPPPQARLRGKLLGEDAGILDLF